MPIVITYIARHSLLTLTYRLAAAPNHINQLNIQKLCDADHQLLVGSYPAQWYVGGLSTSFHMDNSITLQSHCTFMPLWYL
ncbi:hypothetical protein E4U58_007464 [Claviceps cyperi]|nr:hypothetical protein E4U58_007464 [Claviceps cyperi]